MNVMLRRLKDFDKETFFRSVSEKSIGYYVQGMKLTLFFLYFYDEIDESKFTKYREMINIICNCGVIRILTRL